MTNARRPCILIGSLADRPATPSHRDEVFIVYDDGVETIYLASAGLTWVEASAPQVWEETSGVAHLTTGANNVTIGSSTNLAKLGVDGDADEVQLAVRGGPSQTALLAVFEDENGDNQLTIGVDGALAVNIQGASNTAAFNLQGSGGVDLLHANANSNILGVGAAPSDPAAILEITSTTKGVLLSRMTTTQRNNISSPQSGLIIYNQTTQTINQYNGSAWVEVDHQILTTKGDLKTFSTVPARLPIGTNGYMLTPDSAETTGLKWIKPRGTVARYSYTVAANTGGLSFTSGADRTVALNTEDQDPDAIGSLASNQVTIQPGVYWVVGQVSFVLGTRGVRLFIYDVDGAANVIQSVNLTGVTASQEDIHMVSGLLVVASANAYEFRLRATNNISPAAALNLGGVSEVYATLEFVRLA